MIHLDLFSGIGGFAYAADRVFGDVEHVFCDNDKFCRAVLNKHWPESEIYDDIRSITDTPSEGLQGQGKQQSPGRSWAERHVDILTGGFPCQPFSAAGLRRGTSDDRHLWPEMLRVIQLTKPTWVIAEKVRGITNWNEGVVFEQVCADLEASGYEVQPFIIPAVAVNAPHRRDRVWFIAYAKNQPGRRGASGQNGSAPSQIQERDQVGKSTESDQVRSTSYAGRLRGKSGRGETLRSEGQKSKRQNSIKSGKGYSWESDWTEVAAELCRVDDGLPAELDGLKLSKPQHRKEQLKAYGNAIVPQVAMQIMEAMIA